MQMKFSLKKLLTKLRRILQNPGNFRFVFSSKKKKQSGILLVIHESQELGASILALHIAEQLISLGSNVYIVSRQFGKMNKKYNQIAPVQIALSIRAYRRVCKKLYNNGYRKALMVTASTGDLVKITKDCGYEIVSMIHELDQVITMLHLENATKEMLEYSDKVLFSTSVAKKQVLKLCNVEDSNKIVVKPQGIYYDKPSEQEIKEQKQRLLDEYPALKDKIIIAGIGNTTERKGFDIFLQTAELMPERMFVWAGKKEIYFNEIVKKYGTPENFIYLGMLDFKQLSGVYALANVYLMCSRFDTLPSTIFEALLFGVPVVGSKTSGGIVDVIKDNNGYLTENTNSSDFTKAINTVLNTKYSIQGAENSFEEYAKYVLTLFEGDKYDQERR